MFNFSQFEKLSKGARDEITEETLQEAANGSPQPHSIQTIIAQNRDIAIAARMTSKPMLFKRFRASEDGILFTEGDTKSYSGADIANIFVDSCKKFGSSYYPIAGDWRDLSVRQLILFVKDDGAKKYRAYARFEVASIRPGSTMSKAEMANLVDVSVLAHCTYKSILEIRLIDTSVDGLPEDFLGNRSGKSVYDVAFLGSSPNILVI
jgi:hypothetical protein